MLVYHFFKDLVGIKINYDIGKKTWFGTGGRAKILYIVIDMVGWHGLFVIAGFVTSTTSFGIFSLFDGDEYGIWDDPGEN